MNFRDLQYLVAVAETEHFGRAAENCFVSQPTLSMQLKKLESELDVQLFERDKKQVRLTREGAVLVEQAQVILREMQALKDMAKLVSDPLSGDFRLGSIPTLSPYLLPHITPDLRALLPRVNFYLYEEKTAVLLDMLKTGKLDAAILALPIQDVPFHVEYLSEEPFYAALPSGHRLADREAIDLSDLASESLLLLGDGHCMRDHALSACDFASGSEVSGGFQATSLETLRHMVAMGSGVTLLPALSLSFSSHADIEVVPFADNPAPSRKIGVVWRKSAVNGDICRKLCEVTQAALTSIIGDI